MSTRDARQRRVHRLDLMFLASLLVTSGLAALLFWTQFYDAEDHQPGDGATVSASGADSVDPATPFSMTLTPTPEPGMITPMPPVQAVVSVAQEGDASNPRLVPALIGVLVLAGGFSAFFAARLMILIGKDQSH